MKSKVLPARRKKSASLTIKNTVPSANVKMVMLENRVVCIPKKEYKIHNFITMANTTLRNKYVFPLRIEIPLVVYIISLIEFILKPGSHMPPTYLGHTAGGTAGSTVTAYVNTTSSPNHSLSLALTSYLPAKLN